MKKKTVRIQPLAVPAKGGSLLTNCSRLRTKKKAPVMTLQGGRGVVGEAAAGSVRLVMCGAG